VDWKWGNVKVGEDIENVMSGDRDNVLIRVGIY